MTTRGPPVHIHQATRNPWGGPDSSSSASSRTYHCPVDWYEPHYSQPARTPSPQYDVIEGPRLNRLMVPVPVGSRAVTPASTAHTNTHIEGAVDPCGGHCTTFETFCHYCLQVAFIAGILTGISLTIAGSVLRGQKRGGDLMVLVYIGCLTAMVCTLLLSVQCCVRRNVKRRKRGRPQAIPLQDFNSAGAAAQPLTQPQPPLPHCETLLRTASVQRQPLNQRYIPESHHLSDSLARGDHSGTPWWRRQPPHSSKLPHSHVQMPL